MKILLRIFGIVLLGVVWAGRVQAQSNLIDQFAVSVQAGNFKEVVKYFNENIAINLEGNRQSANKAQSESLLKDFMTKYPPTKFEFKHQGAAGASGFAVGKYTSASTDFRIVVKTDGKMIEKIDFTKE